MVWTLVTGGCRGLGAVVCRLLASQGHDVIVHYRTSKEEAEQVVHECKSYGTSACILQGDFSSSEGVENFLQKLQPYLKSTRFLINNVGEYATGPFGSTPDSSFTEMHCANVVAPMLITKALLPSLIEHKGRIVNIGTAGLNRGAADWHAPLYMSTKRALLSLTQSLAKELAPHQVNVNMVSPGYMENSVHLPDDVASLPFGRTATLEEVARLVLFFLGNDASYITGQNIEITGGVRL